MNSWGKRQWFGWAFVLIGLTGLAITTWRFSTIPDLEIRPESLEVRGSQACGIEPEGTVVCWGEWVDSDVESDRRYGFWARVGPARVEGIDDALALASQDSTTCALRSTGTVACWGWFRDPLAAAVDSYQRNDELLGSIPYSRQAVAITELADVVELAAGESELCALDQSGVVSCFLRSTRRTFEPSDDFKPAHDLIVVENSVCAIDDQRNVVCKGLSADIDDPAEQLFSDVDWLSGTTSDWSGDLACAGRDGGQPTCWTNNRDGDRLIEPLPTLSGTRNMYQLMSDICGVDDGRVRCVENRTLSRSIDLDYAELPAVEVDDLDDVVVAGSDGFRSCASQIDGRVSCWGSAGRFQTLGDAANTMSSSSPVVVAAWGVSQHLRWLWQGMFLLPLAIGVWLLSRRSKPRGTAPL